MGDAGGGCEAEANEMRTEWNLRSGCKDGATLPQMAPANNPSSINNRNMMSVGMN